MKDTRFIELVNLYIDRQISAEETAELEAEIQSNPRHRQVYHQYCHMHRATRLVYESFRAHGEQGVGSVAEPGSIAYFAHRRQRVRRAFWWSTATATAAAACLAIYVVRLNNGSAPLPAAPAIRVAAAAPKPISAPVALTPAASKAMVEADYNAMLAALHQVEQRNLTLNQSQPVRPVALFDDGVFAGNSTLASDGHGVVVTKGKVDTPTPAEFTAFQFQR